MEPLNKNVSLYYLVSLTEVLPKLGGRRDLYISIFADLSSKLARIAYTPLLLNDYKIIFQELMSEGDLFNTSAKIKKIQEFLFLGITSHAQFKELPLREVVNLLKSGAIPPELLDKFKQHPAIVNMTKDRHKKIRKEAEARSETSFLKIWVHCFPSRKYVPREMKEREHVQITREMRRDAPNLSSAERKKGMLYIAIENGRYTTADYYLKHAETMTLQDAVYYLYKVIEIGNLELTKLILDKYIMREEHSCISEIFKDMDMQFEPDKAYAKLALKVFEKKEFDVLSVMLRYEAEFFDDNASEQLLEDLIDDCIKGAEFDKVRSFYDFAKFFDIDQLIENSAKFVLYDWIREEEVEKIVTLLEICPACLNLVLEIAAKVGKPEVLASFIGVNTDLLKLLNYAKEEENFKNVNFLIETYKLKV